VTQSASKTNTTRVVRRRSAGSGHLSEKHHRTDGAADPPHGSKRWGRRRQIDPTTCEREYTSDEIEFMQALDAYKRKSGRMFPTCSEILEVLRNLGYRRCVPEHAVIASR